MLHYEEYTPGLLLLIHGTSSPTKEEWDACTALTLEICRREGRIKLLVASAGGAPNAQQRSQAMAATSHHTLQAAVLAESSFMRGIVTAFQWLSRNNEMIKAFKPSALGKAMSWLEVDVDLAKLSQRIDEQLTAMSSRVA